MREFLDQTFGEKSTVNDFVHSMTHTQWSKSDNILPPALYQFEHSPGEVAHSLLTYIATAPRELTDTASEILDQSKGYVQTEQDQLDLKALAVACKELGEQMDVFTKALAKSRVWAPIYNGPVSVIRVWCTKRNEEMVGTPEIRNLPIDKVPNRLSSIVLVEEETSKGVRVRPMLSVSDGHYRMDGAIGEVREDFLIDLKAMFVYGMEDAGVGRRGRGCGRDGTMKLFTQMMNEALPLIEATLAVVKPLHQRGVVTSDIYNFEVENVYTPGANPLKAEDNPDALYDIGGWS